MDRTLSPLLDALRGQVVVVDLSSEYVCIGTLTGADRSFLDIRDADLHDLRDSSKNRETYVYDSARLGVRRNRTRVLLRKAEVVAVSLLSDIMET
ncbi:MAG: hypothetical protein U0800_04465 [Isosphaeraceae bacterium]